MSIPRDLALRISAFVARHASLGNKEWAEGMAREVAYIEGDWAALGWALGSMRILFDLQPVPLRSMADVRESATKFVEMSRNALRMIYPMMIGPSLILMRRDTANSWQLRAGLIIAAAGSIACWVLWFVDRNRLPESVYDKVYDNDRDCALFYRAELERFRFTMWIPAFGLWSCLIGYEVKHWHSAYTGPWISVYFLMLAFCCWVLWQAWRNNERKIEQIDALLEQEA
jgi:hypothetical protein